jgi:hypothetical protein
MTRKNSDQSATQKARDQLRKAEEGDATPDELGRRAGTGADPSAESVEQEASDGPAGRGLTR